MKRKVLLCLFLLCFNVLAKAPEPVKPIQNFDVKRYMGTWYEIARLDHWFERDQENVTLTYSLEKDGDIRIHTQALEKGKLEENWGWAKFTGARDVGLLKISFFRPFYKPYLIFELDKNYQYAFLSSEDKKYLWFLARKKKVSSKLKKRFVQQAKKLGFNLDGLIWVKHSP